MSREREWKPTGQVSATCEYRLTDHGDGITVCGEPTTLCYPAMGGGYMALCDEHGERHRAYSVSYQDALEGKTPPNPREDARREAIRLRHSVRWNQTVAAAALGISTATYSKRERYGFSADELSRLAAAVRAKSEAAAFPPSGRRKGANSNG